MNIEIFWKVESTEWNLETGGVTTAHWRVVASDEENTVDAYGSVGFSPDPENPNFISLDNLSEEDVILWVKEYINAEEIESSLVSQLDKLKNPVSQSGLPWTTIKESDVEL